MKRLSSRKDCYLNHWEVGGIYSGLPARGMVANCWKDAAVSHGSQTTDCSCDSRTTVHDEVHHVSPSHFPRESRLKCPPAVVQNPLISTPLFQKYSDKFPGLWGEERDSLIRIAPNNKLNFRYSRNENVFLPFARFWLRTKCSPNNMGSFGSWMWAALGSPSPRQQREGKPFRDGVLWRDPDWLSFIRPLLWFVVLGWRAPITQLRSTRDMYRSFCILSKWLFSQTYRVCDRCVA